MHVLCYVPFGDKAVWNSAARAACSPLVAGRGRTDAEWCRVGRSDKAPDAFAIVTARHAAWDALRVARLALLCNQHALCQ